MTAIPGIMAAVPGIMILLVLACRVAFGSEAIATPAGDPNFWRLLDYGALGIFTAYLVWDRHQRDKKDQKTADRFAAMDQKIVQVTQDAVVAMNIVSVAAAELRASVEELSKVLYTKPCLRPADARTRESDR